MGKRWAIVLGVAAAGVMAFGAPPASATFPGTDGRIAFNAFSDRTKGIEIYTATPNGGDVRRLTSTPDTLAGLPDWSPDGERIAFYTESFRPGPPAQVHAMNADGSDVTQLTSGPGFKGLPNWSPDADSLAIVADWGDETGALQGIWIIPASDPDGVTQEEARRVTTKPAGFDSDIDPQFSPDGSSIAFTRLKTERKSAIHRVGIDGTGLERLTPWRLNASDPDWSPDGQRIAFDSGDAEAQGSKGNIYVMRADGSGRKRLTDFPPLRKGCCPVSPPGFASEPVWSPSGTQIMNTRFFPKRTELVAMKPNGSGKHVVVGGRFGKHHFPNASDWGTHP